MPLANVFVCLPAFGRQCCSETALSLVHAIATLMTKQIGFMCGTLSYPDIAELRNVAATIFYDTMPECTHLFFCDSDMKFEPNLISDFIAFDKPLVGAMYRMKDDPIAYVGNPLPGAPQLENGYLKCHDIGCGAMLIRRDCFQNILEKNHQLSDLRMNRHSMKELLAQHGVKRIIRFFDLIDKDDGRLSEDLSFCKRVRDSGMEVWASINHEITHIGLKGFTGRFADQMKNA